MCCELGRGTAEIDANVAVEPLELQSPEAEAKYTELDELADDGTLMKLAALSKANLEHGKSVLSE